MRPTLWVGLVFNHMVLHFVNQENKVVLLVQMAESSLRYMAHRSTWMEVERGSKQRSLQPSPFYWRGNVCQWLSLWIQCSAFITELSPQPFRLLLPSAWYPHISRETDPDPYREFTGVVVWVDTNSWRAATMPCGFTDRTNRRVDNFVAVG